MMQIKKEIEEANKILKEIAEALDTEDWEHVVPHDDYLKKKKSVLPNNYMII